MQSEYSQLQNVRISTLNIEGAVSNQAYVTKALRKEHIICLQEHWLYKFEQKKLHEIFPKWSAHIRSVDEEEGIQPTHKRVAGHGGVATLWHHMLDPYVTRSEEGNTRILVTLFSIPSSPVCIINCYLPSGTSADAISKFREDLDLIHGIIVKYQDKHDVLVIGDLNEDHFGRLKIKEVLAKELIQELELEDLGLDIGTLPTYINTNLGHSSHLDHILLKKRSTAAWTKAAFHDSNEDAGLNTSTHLTISTSIACQRTQSKSMKNKKRLTITKYKWNEADADCFAATVDEILQEVDINKLLPEHALGIFHRALQTATEVAVPSTRAVVSQKKMNPKWSVNYSKANKNAKLKHHEWKLAGRPHRNHPTTIEKNRAKRQSRRVMRTEEEQRHQELIQQIGEASENDQALFHKLIRRQRQSHGCQEVFLIDGRLVSEDDEIREEWAKYYFNLSNPSGENDSECRLLKCMRILASLEPSSVIITTEVITEAIGSLRNKKAPDIKGVSAEQLKLLSSQSLEILRHIIQEIFHRRNVPEILKASYKLAIPKKGKDARIQDNHRGITIAPLIGKIVEIICAKSGVEHDIHQNGLQFGFSAGRSPSMASLVITEAIAEAKEKREILISASLDARKAFDVVNHYKLKAKLFNTKLKKSVWSIVDDLYVGGCEVFRWKGEFSSPYTIGQGVKQGGIVSPSLYKLYIYNLLESLRGAGMGLYIGPIYVGTPACADDVLLLSNNPPELQGMLDVSDAYSHDHDYEIHPVKTTSTILHKPRNCNTGSEQLKWNLNENPIPVADEFTHLGLEWTTGKTHPNIDKAISAARRTTYSLFGTGLHGRNGLGPVTSRRLIQLYILPRLLHGLDAAVLSKSQVEKLEVSYRKLLRMMMGLPESTAKEAVYLLMGALPLEAILHQRILSLFGNISRLDNNNPLKALALRQLALKDPKSGSWFGRLQEAAARYDIRIHEALHLPWPKVPWKMYCKKAVTSYWHLKLIKEAVEKSTLKLIIWNITDFEAHGVWRSCSGQPRLVEAASTRARMMVQRYSINSVRWRQAQGETSSCPLCGHNNEDMEHFLIICPKLSHIREERVKELQNLYAAEDMPHPTSPSELCSAVINGDRFYTGSPGWGQLEVTSRLTENSRFGHLLCTILCHKLHTERESIMNDLTATLE